VGAAPAGAATFIAIRLPPSEQGFDSAQLSRPAWLFALAGLGRGAHDESFLNGLVVSESIP